MSRSQQRKGRAGERELAELLQRYGYDVRPGEPLNFGQEPDLIGLPGIHCEVKRHETIRINEWMRQSQEDAEKFGDGAPAVFYRRNREPWHVVMKLEDFLRFYGGKNNE